MSIGHPTIEALEALALGFAFAGLLSSAFQLVTERPVGFHVLRSGGFGAVASVPVLVFSAPLVILRHALVRPVPRRSKAVILSLTILAALWSLVAGRALLDLAQAVAGA